MVFCSKCGAELPADTQFCPKCGRPANEPVQPRPFEGMGRREMRHAYRDARRAERRGRRASPEWVLFNTIFGGLFVILLGGLLFLAASETTDLVTWSNFWAYLLMGLGILLLVRGFLGLLARRYFEYGNIIGGMVLIVIGAAGVTMLLTGWTKYIWIVVIIVGGLLIILAGLLTYLFRR